MSDRFKGPIWDGNGGHLDPAQTSLRDLLVALNVKMDSVVIPTLADLKETVRSHEGRLRKQEDGEMTRGQRAAVLAVAQEDEDQQLTRRSLKAPIVAVLISVASLVTVLVLTLTTGGVAHGG